MVRVLILTSVLVLVGLGPVCLGAEGTASLDDAAAQLEARGTPRAGRAVAIDTIIGAGIRSLPHIRALLKSKNWQARRDALTLAFGVKPPDLTVILAGGLKDRNWAVRERGAERAAKLAATDRVKIEPALRNVLSDKIMRVRLAAYKAFSEWDPESEVLLNALNDPDREIKYWAARSFMEGDRLDKLPPGAKARLGESIIETFRRQDWKDINIQSIRAAISLGQDALYDAIASEETTARRRAVSRLGAVGGDEATGLLFRFVTDPDTAVRRNAVAAVCSRCTAKFAPRLLAFAKSSSDQGVRYQVIRAFGRLKYRPAIPYLLKAAEGANSGHRRAAFRAVATMGDKALAPKLIAIYKRETRSYERTRMIDPIASLLRHEAVAFLKDAVSDSDQSIRSQALHAARAYLKNDDRTSILLELIRTEESDHVRRAAIASLSVDEAGKAVDLLIEVMKDGGQQSRRAAAQALGRSKSPAGVRAVIKAFETEQDLHVRMAMLSALAQAQAKQAVPALKKILSADDPRMKATALRALSRFEGALDSKVLIGIVETEEDAQVLQTCVRFMEERGILAARLLPRFAELMKSDSTELRRMVLQIVGRIDDPRVTKMLCTAIKDDISEENRRRALRSLVAILASKRIPATTLVAPLGEVLKTGDANARRSIMSAVSSRMEPALVPVVLDVLKGDTEASVRLAAAKTIKQVADKQIVPQLIAATRAEDDTNTLVVLIDVLAAIEDDRALPVFRAKLKSTETSVQAAALRAIGRFRSSALIPFYVERYKLSTSVGVRLTALRNMQGSGDRRTTETVLSALKDGDPRIRRAALEIAADLAETRVVAVLAARLTEKDIGHGAATAIADAVGGIRSRVVASQLLAALNKADDADSRMQILAALAKSGDRRAIPVLAAAAKERSSSDLTRVAIAGLAELGAREHAALCLEIAGTSTGRLSRLAASAAAKLDGGSCFAYLVGRFQRAGEREKRFYAALIAEADPDRADAVLRTALAEARGDGLIAALCSSLSAVSDENTAAVREIALGGFGPEARLAAVRFLGGGPSVDAANTLELMTHPRRASSVRAAALLQLIRARPEGTSAIAIAAEWLGSQEQELRVSAAEVLAVYALLPEAKRLIPVARKDGDKCVRAIAVRALGAMTGNKQAEEVLIELLEEGAGGMASDAVRSLGRLRSKEAVAKLSKFVSVSKLGDRVAAVEALGHIATADAINAVEGAFHQADVGRVRAAAALALGATGNAAYVARLAEALKTSPGIDARAACAQALGRLGGEAAGGALTGALEQDSALVREAAVRALAEPNVPCPPDVFKRLLKDSDLRVADAARQAVSALRKGK